MTLVGLRVLVADDQLDVARTLCEPLRALGATLTFVGDARAALDQIQSGPYDACITDMKMEPAPWGGLWLLAEMQSRELGTPVIVLSGEGAQRQTIEAMRLGAADWVDKTSASMELPERCEQAVIRHRAEARQAVTGRLPVPLSGAYSRYFSTIGSAVQYGEGLKTLEESVRLAALVGLALLAPTGTPVMRIAGERLARPALGTWLELVRELARPTVAHPVATTLVRALGLDRRAEVDEFVQVRNDLHHGGPGASRDDVRRLDAFLHGAAARVDGAWPYRFVTPVSMQWDGAFFRTEVRPLTIGGASQNLTLISDSPLKTGQPVISGGDNPIGFMWPWLTHSHGGLGADDELLVFDGIHAKSGGGPRPEDALTYTSTQSRARMQRPASGGRWGDVSSLFGGRGH